MEYVFDEITGKIEKKESAVFITNCPNCNKEVKNDFKFCPYCGLEIPNDISGKESLKGVLFESLGKSIPEIEQKWIWNETIEGEFNCSFNEKGMNLMLISNAKEEIQKLIIKGESGLLLPDLIRWIGFGSEIKNIAQIKKMAAEEIDSHNFNLRYEDSNHECYRCCFHLRKDNTIRYVLVERYNDKSAFYSLFPIYGVTLGETSFYQLKKTTKIQESEEVIQCTVNGIRFFSAKGGNKVLGMMIDKSVKMPEKLKDFGFNWSYSYEEYAEFLKKKGYDDNYWDSSCPKVVSKKGRNMLYATIGLSLDDCLDCTLVFDMGNENGEGSSTTSRNSLYKIEITLVELDVCASK